MRTNKQRGEDGEDGWSSRANLENVKSQTGQGMRLTEQAVTDSLSQTHISGHSTDDVKRQNNEDKGKANHASTKRMIRQNVVVRGLLNQTLVATHQV